MTLVFYSCGLAATAAPTPTAASIPIALCVEDTTRVPDAVRAAVTELNTAQGVAITYSRGLGCKGARVVHVRQAALSPEVVAYTTGDTVLVNRMGRFTTYTPEQRYLVALHELMHVVVGRQPTDRWDSGGHTSRCDSVLSRDRVCIFRTRGLTPFDRALIASVAEAAQSRQ